MSVDRKTVRDLLLPGLADVEGKIPPICLDLAWNRAGGLDLLLWPNSAAEQCDVAHRVELLTPAEVENSSYKEFFGMRLLKVVQGYERTIAA